MKPKRFLIALCSLFAFIVFFDWLVHINLFAFLYIEEADAFRPIEQQVAFFPLFLGFRMALAILLTLFFSLNPKEWLSRSLFAGALMGLTESSFAVFLPVPLSFFVLWLIAPFLLGLFSGLIFTLTYPDRSKVA